MTVDTGDSRSRFETTRYQQRRAAFSPDGRWLAYVGLSSSVAPQRQVYTAPDPEVYICSFPACDGRNEGVRYGGAPHVCALGEGYPWFGLPDAGPNDTLMAVER